MSYPHSEEGTRSEATNPLSLIRSRTKVSSMMSVGDRSGRMTLVIPRRLYCKYVHSSSLACPRINQEPPSTSCAFFLIGISRLVALVRHATAPRANSLCKQVSRHSIWVICFNFVSMKRSESRFKDFTLASAPLMTRWASDGGEIETMQTVIPSNYGHDPVSLSRRRRSVSASNSAMVDFCNGRQKGGVNDIEVC